MRIKNKVVYLHSRLTRTTYGLDWEHSSAGLERLPYKQRVGGPNPSAPTKKNAVAINCNSVFRYITYKHLSQNFGSSPKLWLRTKILRFHWSVGYNTL